MAANFQPPEEAYVSPFTDRYARFGAAARLISTRDPFITYDDALDALVRAMWDGEFDSPLRVSSRDGDDKVNEDGLRTLISVPPSHLSAAQRSLSPQPAEYFTVRRASILSVMYCDGLLPGDQAPWTTIMARDRDFEERDHEALDALAGIPCSSYSRAGRAYLEAICISRAKLLEWFDARGWSYGSIAEPNAQPAWVKPVSRSANDREAQTKREKSAARGPRRGRPKLAAWVVIKAAVKKLRNEQPGLQNKELAYEARQRALACFPEEEVPGETTIFRRLSEF